MDNVSAEEWEMLSFFEVEPELLDQGVPWSYNDARYVVDRGELCLTFALAPAYRDVRIILSHRGKRVYEFNAMAVQDVRYRNERGDETLEVLINDRERVSLQLKPSIEILHHFSRAEG